MRRDGRYYYSWATGIRLALVLALLATLISSAVVLSQVAPGASLTVVRGLVSVSRADGTSTYPAGTGLTLAPGDTVATLDRTRAIVTFFTGSEVELGSNTVIIIRDLNRGLLNQTQISLQHVTGLTVARMAASEDPDSVMTLISGDTVAELHHGEVGHAVDPTTNNITAVCVLGCELNGLAFPNPTSFVADASSRTLTGRGDVIDGRVPPGASVWDVMAEAGGLGESGNNGVLPSGATTGSESTSHEGGQPPVREPPDHERPPEVVTVTTTPGVGTATATPTATVPPGGPTFTPTVTPGGPTFTPTVTPGGPTFTPTATPGGPTFTPTVTPGGPTFTPSTTPTSNPFATPTPTMTPTNTVTPLPTPTPPPGTPGPTCDTPVINAGATITATVHNLGRTSGTVTINFNATAGGAQFIIIREGTLIFTTGGLVTGNGTATIPLGTGLSSFVTVIVIPGLGSTWTYTIPCP